ncbi:hypothetical protein ACIQNU_42770 [Streptomyces sp. NPDC091292]|uniref:hypothetical protein n=1 Tax=Streptomyces sp. NPDC091292 TaxID=3365991 RepID=UPI0038014EB5
MSPLARLAGLRSAFAIGTVLGCLALSGCSESDHANSPPAGAGTATAPSVSPAKTPERPEHIPGESVTQAPKLISGKPLTEVASAKGNRVMEIGEIQAQPLSVLVNCQGEGTLTVELEPVGLSFPLECVAEEVSSTYNEMRLKQPRKKGTVSVTAPSTVRWSLTVGQ